MPQFCSGDASFCRSHPIFPPQHIEIEQLHPLPCPRCAAEKFEARCNAGIVVEAADVDLLPQNIPAIASHQRVQNHLQSDAMEGVVRLFFGHGVSGCLSGCLATGFTGALLAINVKPRSLDQAITFTHLVFTTDERPAFVDRAFHGVSVQCRTPAIVQAAHHDSAPLVLAGKSQRYVIIAHQQDFQPATTGFAGGARDGGAVVRATGCFNLFNSGIHRPALYRTPLPPTVVSVFVLQKRATALLTFS